MLILEKFGNHRRVQKREIRPNASKSHKLTQSLLELFKSRRENQQRKSYVHISTK